MKQWQVVSEIPSFSLNDKNLKIFNKKYFTVKLITKSKYTSDCKPYKQNTKYSIKGNELKMQV